MTEVKKKEGRLDARPWETVNPFDAVREVMNRMMDTFMEPLARIASPPIQVPLRGFQPRVDVIEEDEEIRIEVEVPGMGPEDLSVTLGADTVVIRGEKKVEETEGKGVHRRERASGPFRRVVHLPVEVDRDRVEASFRNGVLTVRLPKPFEAAKKIEIKTE